MCVKGTCVLKLVRFLLAWRFLVIKPELPVEDRECIHIQLRWIWSCRSRVVFYVIGAILAGDCCRAWEGASKWCVEPFRTGYQVYLSCKKQMEFYRG